MPTDLKSIFIKYVLKTVTEKYALQVAMKDKAMLTQNQWSLKEKKR